MSYQSNVINDTSINKNNCVIIILPCWLINYYILEAKIFINGEENQFGSNQDFAENLEVDNNYELWDMILSESAHLKNTYSFLNLIKFWTELLVP